MTPNQLWLQTIIDSEKEKIHNSPIQRLMEENERLHKENDALHDLIEKLTANNEGRNNNEK